MRYFLGILSVIFLILVGAYVYLVRQHQGTAAYVTVPGGTANPATGRDSSAASDAAGANALDQEARAYIRDLTTIKPQALPAQNADNFVRRDQSIRLHADTPVEQVTRKELLADPALSPDSSITVVKEVDQVEVVTPEKLLERAGTNLDKPVQVMEGDTVKQTTVRELVEKYPDQPKAPITIVKKVEEVQVMTAKQLEEDKSIAADQPIKVIRGKQRVNEATVAELLTGNEDKDSDAVYYVRTVKDTDIQGIWGIIRGGLMDNFARGIAIKRGEDLNTYQIEIPRNADQMIDDTTSSFLGRMIYDKSRDTYVYNFEQGRMGRNPDLIHPGQELLIVRFSSAEIIAIYKHFVSGRNT